MNDGTREKTPLDYALQHALRGWSVFPVRPQSHGEDAKKPFRGFMDWERQATSDSETLAAWWLIDYGEDALPAIAPGKSGRVVIDVDRHEGRPDGFASLIQSAVHIAPSVPRFPSLSGNGMHFWYRAAITSRNSLLPGVDRKGQGGYIIAMYDLPEPSQVSVKLPADFHGANPTAGADPYDGHPGEWLSARAGLTPSPRARYVVQRLSAEVFDGHERLLKAQAHLVMLGREGHGGVPEALADIREMWLAVPHLSGDPHKEWVTALAGAIKKYGGAS